jgi:signal transduction histidine kinase
MSGWRTFALVAAVASAGAIGTLAVAAVTGMNGNDLAHLLLTLVPAVLATIVAALLTGRLLARSSLRQRFVAVALVAATVALANVAVLTTQMFVSEHDARLVTVLLLYAVATGLAAALAVARSSNPALRRLEGTARRLGDGDLSARVGELGAGPELDALGEALDEMAGRLQVALDRERAAELMRGDLITAVSHDLRTPLASLRAMVEAVDDGVIDDRDDLRRYAAEMRRSTAQLTDLVDDLFELTQLDSGAISGEMQRAPLDDLVASALEIVRAEAGRKRLTLRSELGDAGDSPCSPRLARVLQNLLSNAVRHTPADGTVRVTAGRVGEVIELAVEDTGTGIAPVDLPHVFEPFYRADQARTGVGSGLGLTLAKRIVEALGGSIRAESRPTGSRFAVELPVG